MYPVTTSLQSLHRKKKKDAEVDDCGIQIRGRPIANLRYTDSTALIVNNHMSICVLLERVSHIYWKYSISRHCDRQSFTGKSTRSYLFQFVKTIK